MCRNRKRNQSNGLEEVTPVARHAAAKIGTIGAAFAAFSTASVAGQGGQQSCSLGGQGTLLLLFYAGSHLRSVLAVNNTFTVKPHKKLGKLARLQGF